MAMLVPGTGFKAGQVPEFAVFFMDQDGVFFHGLAGVGVDGQGLVFNLDLFQRCLGGEGVFCDDGGDVVADVAHPVDRPWGRGL